MRAPGETPRGGGGERHFRRPPLQGACLTGGPPEDERGQGGESGRDHVPDRKKKKLAGGTAIDAVENQAPPGTRTKSE